MKSAAFAIAVILGGCVVLLFGCSKSTEYLPEPPDPYFELRQQIAKSPRADEEAELMALWMSGDVVAYDRDYLQVRDALSLVRGTFSDTIPYLDSVNFVYRFQESVIGLVLSDYAVQQLRAGTFVEWDSLNELYRLSEIDTTWLAGSGHITLSFEGRLNPQVLSARYGLLDGVDAGFLFAKVGDYSNIYPWRSGYDHTFLLRRGWENCVSQCEGNEFWYFKVNDGNARYIGGYVADGAEEPPVWWDEAEGAFCTYISHWLCYR